MTKRKPWHTTRILIDMKCLHCGKRFIRQQKTPNTTAKYCSPTCKRRAQQRRYYAAHRAQMIARMIAYKRSKKK